MKIVRSKKAPMNKFVLWLDPYTGTLKEYRGEQWIDIKEESDKPDLLDVTIDNTSIVDAEGIALIPTVSATGKGLMTPSDKSKLDKIPENATTNKGTVTSVNGQTPDINGNVNVETGSGSTYVHPTYTIYQLGLYKITVNELGHVSLATAVTKDDITALGIPELNTVYSDASETTAGLFSADNYKLLKALAAGTVVKKVNNIDPDENNNVTLPVNTTILQDSTNPVTSDAIYKALLNKLDVLSTTLLSNINFLSMALIAEIAGAIEASLTVNSLGEYVIPATGYYAALDNNSNILISNLLVNDNYYLVYSCGSYTPKKTAWIPIPSGEYTFFTTDSNNTLDNPTLCYLPLDASKSYLRFLPSKETYLWQFRGSLKSLIVMYATDKVATKLDIILPGTNVSIGEDGKTINVTIPSEYGKVKTVNNVLPDNNGNVQLPASVTVDESTVSTWGFTKNTGTVKSVNNVMPDAAGNVTIPTGSTIDASDVLDWGFYLKPSAGIPITDLTLAVLNILNSAGTVKTVNNTSPDSSGNVALTLPSSIGDITGLTEALAAKQKTLTPGTNITIAADGTISASLPEGTATSADLVSYGSTTVLAILDSLTSEESGMVEATSKANSAAATAESAATKATNAANNIPTFSYDADSKTLTITTNTAS